MSIGDVVDLTRPDVIDQPSRLAFKINNFDAVRLFAAVQVAIFHGYHRLGLPEPAWIAPLSWFQGVPIFFVISGFLISASLERQKSLVTYARNRALRIFPGLWACILSTAVVAMLCGIPFGSLESLRWLALQCVGLIYTPEFLRGFGDGAYNGSLWTIPLELQFYAMLVVVYALVARFRHRTRAILLVFLLFLGVGAAIVTLFPDIATPAETPGVKLLRYTFVPRFYLFMLGVALQRLQLHASPWVRGRGLHWLAGYVAFHLIVPQVGLVYMLDELLLGVTVIAVAYTAPTFSERALRGNDISYGVYLYHGLVINIMIELALAPGRWSIPAMLAAAFALGALSWLLVERPAMRRKSAAARRPPAVFSADG